MQIDISGLINLEDLSDEIKSQYISRPIEENHVKVLMQVDKKDLPPIKVLHSDKGDAVIDGRHRVERARRMDETKIEAEFINFSSIDDLIMQAWSANQRHGLPEGPRRRVDYALWLIVARGMSVRAAAKEAMIDPSSIVRRKQKLKAQEQTVVEQPVENERLKPLVRFFKALEGLKAYSGDDDDFFNDLREVLESASDAIEDIQTNLIALVESYNFVVKTK